MADRADTADRRGLAARLWVPLGVCLVGVTVLALSLPRFGTAMLAVSPAGLAVPGKAPEYTPEQLDRQVERQVSAVGWRPTPETAAVLSALSIAQARNRGFDTAAGRESLQRTSAAARVSLVLTPLDSFVWARLAHAEMLLHGTAPQAAQALRMSMLSARYPRELVPTRLTLGLLLWPALDNDTRRLLLEQITLAQRTMPWALPTVARESNGAGIIRVALAADPEALAGFDRSMVQLQ